MIESAIVMAVMMMVMMMMVSLTVSFTRCCSKTSETAEDAAPRVRRTAHSASGKVVNNEECDGSENTDDRDDNNPHCLHTISNRAKVL